MVRRNHELLEIHRIVGVLPAIDHIHARDRQPARVGAAQVPVEGQAMGVCRRPCDGHGDRQYGVRPQRGFVGRAIERNHGCVHGALLRGVQTGHRLADRPVDILYRLGDALAAVPALVSVAQFHRLFFAGGGAGRYRRPSETPIGENHVRFHRRIAPRVQDLAALHVNDCCHEKLPFENDD